MRPLSICPLSSLKLLVVIYSCGYQLRSTIILSTCYSTCVLHSNSCLHVALSDSGLKESKAYSYVLKCLSENHFDVSIQTGGLKALASLLRTGEAK